MPAPEKKKKVHRVPVRRLSVSKKMSLLVVPSPEKTSPPASAPLEGRGPKEASRPGGGDGDQARGVGGGCSLASLPIFRGGWG